MTDSVQSAREDLAFVKAVVEDRGALPEWLGAHLLAVGVIFGLNLAVVGALSLAGSPVDVSVWSWLPASVIYAPVWFAIHRRSDYAAMGPSARVFAAACMAVLLMTLAIITSLILATARTGVSYGAVWPAIACALYGGAWAVISMVRRKAWSAVVAAGCFALALVCALLVGRPEMLLALGLGLLAFFAAPGLVLMRRPRPRA